MRYSLLTSICSLALGGMVYVFFRPGILWIFSILEYLGLGSILNTVRNQTLPISTGIPEWVLYSLPDGLWLYSYLNFILWVWGGERNIFWLSIVPFIAVASEVLQFYGFLQGTFDWMDIIMYLFFTIIFLIQPKPFYCDETNT